MGIPGPLAIVLPESHASRRSTPRRGITPLPRTCPVVMSQVSRLRLAHIQMALECKGLSASGDMIRIPGENPDRMSRFRVISYPGGCVRYFRHDVPPGLRRRLNQLSDHEVLHEFPMAQEIIEGSMGSDAMWAGKTYTFDRMPEPSEFPCAERIGGEWRIAIGGGLASWAVSARQNRISAELGVETSPGFRRRGYARQVSSAWAGCMLKEGLIAFYSHTLDNAPSEALARSLGVTERFISIGY